jgi:hypothetical protein
LYEYYRTGVRRLIFVGFRRESGENKKTPDLLSFPIRFVCGISHTGVNYSTNPVVNFVKVLYFGIFFKKLYLLYIETEGVLLKTVAQAILVYAISIFQIMKRVCKGMMDGISQFWWVGVMRMLKKYIASLGANYVTCKMKKKWVLGISILLI